MSALRQREPRIELPKLRKSAEQAPHCMNPDCLRPNYDKTVVLAHSNWLEHGKGVGYKSHDIFGALICGQPGGCHDKVDGRTGNLSEDARREMWGRAHRATLVYWIQTGILKC